MSQAMDSDEELFNSQSDQRRTQGSTQPDDDDGGGDDVDGVSLLRTGVSADLRKTLAEIKRGMVECSRSHEETFMSESLPMMQNSNLILSSIVNE